jgi:hypothetical protein
VFVGSLCHGAPGPLANLHLHDEVSSYLGVSVLGMRSSSYFVWSMCRIKCLCALHGFCTQDSWFLTSECESSELFRGLCQCVKSITCLEPFFYEGPKLSGCFAGCEVFGCLETVFLL